MGRSNFNPRLTKDHKELLTLLVRLLEAEPVCQSPNSREEEVTLAPAEQTKLKTLLEANLNERLFVDAAHFSEEMTALDKSDIRRLKASLAFHRARLGKSTMHKNWELSEAMLRYGFARYASSFSTRRATKMSFEKFLEKEKLLFKKVGLNEELSKEIIRHIQSKKRDIEALRKNKTRIPAGAVREQVKAIKESIAHPVKGDVVSRIDIISLFSTFANAGAFAQTRDWTIISSISIAASYLIGSVKNLIDS